MNGIIKMYLLVADRFILEMHLRQPAVLFKPGFTYSASRLFTKSKERIQKLKETGDSRYICQNKLHKTCFQHDMACYYFNNLPRRTTSNKVLSNKILILLKIQNMMDVNVDLL